MKKDRLARSRWYPELALFDNEEERKAVLKRFHRRLLLSWRFWLPIVGLSIGNAILIPLASSLARRVFPGVSHVVVSTLTGTLVGAGFGLGLQFLWYKPCQRYLRERLTAKGVPICLDCGYDLRGQVDPRCPECGKAFDSGLIKPRDGSVVG